MKRPVHVVRDVEERGRWADPVTPLSPAYP